MIQRICMAFSGQSDELDAVVLSVQLGRRLNASVEGLIIAQTVESPEGVERESFNAILHADGVAAGIQYLKATYLEKHPQPASQALDIIDELAGVGLKSGRLDWSIDPKVFVKGNVSFIEKAFLHDLVVCSHQATSSLRETAIHDVLFKTGRPVLFASQSGLLTDPLVVVVAWKPSPQVVHAVTAALPILRIASVCHVVSVDDQSEAKPFAPSAEAFSAYLTSLGVPAVASTITSTSGSPQIELTQFATEKSANLIVMGAYSHSELREFMFGGFTKHVLKQRNHSLLMAH